MRLTKVDEFQFLTCVKHTVWGSKNARFADWRVGDYLAIIVDKQIAGLAEVIGPPYRSQERVWDNGIFPHRIPIKFKYLFDKGRRPQILGKIRDVLVQEWTHKYGWGILNQRLIEGSNANSILEEIRKRPSQTSELLEGLDSLLLDAKAEREKASFKQSRKVNARIENDQGTDDERAGHLGEIGEGEKLSIKEESLHSKAQYLLARIGSVVGCSNFIASNDRRRKFNGTELSSLSVGSLPQMGLNDEAIKRISLIDVIWLKQNAPLCAFEVETSTSVYSGLLRMSDLTGLFPH